MITPLCSELKTQTFYRTDLGLSHAPHIKVCMYVDVLFSKGVTTLENLNSKVYCHDSKNKLADGSSI